MGIWLTSGCHLMCGSVRSTYLFHTLWLLKPFCETQDMHMCVKERQEAVCVPFVLKAFRIARNCTILIYRRKLHVWAFGWGISNFIPLVFILSITHLFEPYKISKNFFKNSMENDVKMRYNKDKFDDLRPLQPLF